jgi:hypothetical protein
MARTVPNVMGDILTSIVVSRSEGLELTPSTAPDFSSAAANEALEHSHEVEEALKPSVAHESS